MRKLVARWDVDVPRSMVDEGEVSEPARIHLGIRLGSGRHETEDGDNALPESLAPAPDDV